MPDCRALYWLAVAFSPGGDGGGKSRELPPQSAHRRMRRLGAIDLVAMICNPFTSGQARPCPSIGARQRAVEAKKSVSALETPPPRPRAWDPGGWVVAVCGARLIPDFTTCAGDGAGQKVRRAACVMGIPGGFCGIRRRGPGRYSDRLSAGRPPPLDSLDQPKVHQLSDQNFMPRRWPRPM